MKFWTILLAEKEFHEEFEKLLEVLGVTSPFFLVVQVWVTLTKLGLKILCYISKNIIGTGQYRTIVDGVDFGWTRKKIFFF